MGNHRKAEKAGYDVGIEGFLRLLLDGDQNFRSLRMLHSVQKRIFSSLINIQSS
jgi:hypothetical protein